MKKKTLHATYEWTPKEALQTHTFWLVFIAIVACKVPFFFYTAHAILHAKGVGMSAANAALVMGVFTVGGVPGKLAGGWLMDRIAARYVFIMGLCCSVVGCFLQININKDHLLLACIAGLLIGIGFGWTYAVANILPGHYFGHKAYVKLVGVFLTLASVVSAPISMIGGMIYDMTKSYTTSFWICIGTCIVAIIALLFSPMPKPPKSKSCNLNQPVIA
jgi:MFS family permease